MFDDSGRERNPHREKGPVDRHGIHYACGYQASSLMRAISALDHAEGMSYIEQNVSLLTLRRAIDGAAEDLREAVDHYPAESTNEAAFDIHEHLMEARKSDDKFVIETAIRDASRNLKNLLPNAFYECQCKKQQD